MAERFTERQGQYLAFIHLYTVLNKRPPAEADFQDYFGVTAPSVHQMIVSLENRGLIQKTPGKPRSIRLLVPPETLPRLEGSLPATAGTSFTDHYPHIAFWIKQQGRIELGYDYNTDTCARAIDEGGMPWGGGNPDETIEEWLAALEAGIEQFVKGWGIR